MKKVFVFSLLITFMSSLIFAHNPTQNSSDPKKISQDEYIDWADILSDLTNSRSKDEDQKKKERILKKIKNGKITFIKKIKMGKRFYIMQQR
jgi:hypothetical protein